MNNCNDYYEDGIPYSLTQDQLQNQIVKVQQDAYDNGKRDGLRGLQAGLQELPEDLFSKHTVMSFINSCIILIDAQKGVKE